MAAKTNTVSFEAKPKVKRPGVHAKSKTSKLKSSKNYKKLNRGQGWKIVEIKLNTCVAKKLTLHVLTTN